MRWLAVYGAVLGLFFALQLIAGDGDVLSFPLVERHRYYRLKQRLSTGVLLHVYVFSCATRSLFFTCSFGMLRFL